MKKRLNQPRVEFSTKFNYQLKRVPTDIKNEFIETLELFKENPNHKLLRRHFLKEKYLGYQSIDVTDDYRAVFKETKTENVLIIKFYTIGTHNDLYG